jgi:hypothetical protein
MGGPGQGAGNRVGDLPESSVGMSPSVAKGSVTKGKVLATIIQKTAPEGDAVASTEFIAGAFTKVKQEAEQALTKEEIPPGSREFVRQYFGALDPSGTESSEEMQFE